MQNIKMIQKLCGIVCVLTISWAVSSGKCPKESGTVRRVGASRFFILHGNERDGFVTQAEARKDCQRHGMKLARIRSMLTMATIARDLEKLGYINGLRDTWYWLDAVFDEKSQKYYWGKVEENDVVNYSNFFYRSPRPTGIGAHITFKGEYVPHKPLPQCLTLALPWPWPGDQKYENGTAERIYGHQTCFDERYCESKKSRHAMCESMHADCNTATVKSPFSISEDKVDYFEAGNWIFGDRAYIVNWKHRTFNETVEYCKSLGLQIMSPGTEERKLIPHLKMWSRTITQTQFWTSLRYNAETQQFLNSKGNFVANQTYGTNFTQSFVGGRSWKSNSTFCVALSHSYELKEQMACTNTSLSNGNCNWSFINYVPANCNNYHAAICQHNNNMVKIDWKPIRSRDLTAPLQDYALSNFGFKKNTNFMRSNFKQTFGLLYCPTGYRMIRSFNSTDNTWGIKPGHLPENDVYHYDYLETYWVVDREGFDKTMDSQCTVSYADKDDNGARKIKTVSCTSWHFYICESIKERKDKQKSKLKFSKTATMEWREGPQPRKYPVLES